MQRPLELFNIHKKASPLREKLSAKLTDEGDPGADEGMKCQK